MSKSVRKVPKERTPQWKLDLLIMKEELENEPIVLEREHVEPRPVLFNSEEYDTLHPESTIRLFCGDIREMISRYEGNKERFSELENEMQDLLHYIEMAGDKNANIGYKLYKRLAEIRRKRRACQNEIDLLQPIYDNFKDTDLLTKLADIQGKCSSNRKQIDGRAYTVRTDVLDQFINKG